MMPLKGRAAAAWRGVCSGQHPTLHRHERWLLRSWSLWPSQLMLAYHAALQAAESFALSLAAWGVVRPSSLPRRLDVLLFSLAAGRATCCCAGGGGAQACGNFSAMRAFCARALLARPLWRLSSIYIDCSPFLSLASPAGWILHCYSDHFGERRDVFRSSYLAVFDVS